MGIISGRHTDVRPLVASFEKAHADHSSESE
jgi:hypothetical protein